jgi:hypothetical protein
MSDAPTPASAPAAFYLSSEPIVCVAFREEGRVTSGRYTGVNFSALRRVVSSFPSLSQCYGLQLMAPCTLKWQVSMADQMVFADVALRMGSV